MLYFAYGSNMSCRRLALRIGQVKPLDVGRLNAYSLRFHKVGRLDGSGKCDVVQTGRGGDAVYGVIMDIPDELSQRLDRIEGLGQGYDVRRVIIRDSRDRLLEVRTYVATVTDAALRPFHWYKHHVLAGAREHGLPGHYIEMLESAPSVEDPDSARAAREMAVYGHDAASGRGSGLLS